MWYNSGQGVEQSYTEAVKWYRKAAEQNNPIAQNNLGWCYENGYGVSKNIAEAIQWYKKAVMRGNKLAESNLARLKG